MGINFGATLSSAGRQLRNGVTGIFEKGKALLSGLVDGVKASVESAVKGDVIGIKASEIPNMQAAIQKYVGEVQAALDDFAKQTSTAEAFAGSHADEIKGYINAVSVACDNIVSNMLYFSDRLEAIRKAYEARNEQLASQFSQNATDIKSQFEEYKVGSNVD